MKNISKFIQNLYKCTIQFFFKLIYGEVKYNNAESIDNNLSVKKIENNELLDPDKKNYNLYKIVNGRIYTDYVENVALISKNNILNNISYQQIKGELKNPGFNSVTYKGTPYFKKKINGNVLSLTQGASGHKNYFHWLFDILPKIKIFSEGNDISSLDYFYLSKLQNYQKKTLEILGFDNIKVLDAKKYRHIEAKQIFAVEHPWYTKGYALEEAKNLPSWIIHWIRNSFLNSAKEFNANDKIFIDRSESEFTHCQLQNNEEISSHLIDKGFTKYKVGQLSFENQIYLFKNAKIIVGVHGAAFANLAFCSPNTKIIEIKPVYHPNVVSKTIGNINNLDVKIIETPKIEKQKNISGDIYLNINELNKNL